MSGGLFYRYFCGIYHFFDSLGCGMVRRKSGMVFFYLFDSFGSALGPWTSINATDKSTKLALREGALSLALSRRAGTSSTFDRLAHPRVLEEAAKHNPAMPTTSYSHEREWQEASWTRPWQSINATSPRTSPPAHQARSRGRGVIAECGHKFNCCQPKQQ